MSNPFEGKGRIRRASERQSPFESIVLYLRQAIGLSPAAERRLRKAWIDSDDADRAYLLSLPRDAWAKAATNGKTFRAFLRGEDE